MTFPWRGRLRGTQTTTRRSGSSALSSRMRSSRCLPPRVSFATTRTVFTAPPYVVVVRAGGVARAPAGCVTSGRLNTPCTAPGTPYSYGPPTTVGTVSKLNTGGGGAPLPLERERAPRVGRRACAAPPRGDDVVGEDQRAEPEHERGQRHEQVPPGELLGVVVDPARHAQQPDDVHRGEGQVEEDEGQPEVQLAQRL